MSASDYQPKLKQYSVHYRNVGNEVYSRIRALTFGEDVGQAGWMLPERQKHYIELTGMDAGKAVSDIACGSGLPALRFVADTGCSMTGFDINPDAIDFANATARERGLADKARFVCLDAGAVTKLPLEDDSQDIVLCIDAVTHLVGREGVFADWHRVLKPGGLLLFTDAMTVTGLITNEEIETRTAIGLFQLVPEGFDDRLLDKTGFAITHRQDITDDIHTVSTRWLAARERYEAELRELEGDEMFEHQQRFLTTTIGTAERRSLTSFLFVARKD